MKYHSTVKWEQKPDLYAGENCDEMRPRWFGFAEGDKDGGFDKKIELCPEDFPPGAVVQILLPCCPECEEVQEICEVIDVCEFDWKDWRDGEYS